MDILFFAITGALLNRWRGNGWLIGKTPKQILIGFVVSAIVMIQGYCLFSIIFSGIWMFIALKPSWGPVFDIGRDKDGWKNWDHREKGKWFDWVLTPIFGREKAAWTFKQRWCRDFFGMSFRGFFITLPIGAATDWRYCGVGLSMGLCYEIGFRLAEKTSIKIFKADAIRTAEYIFGAVMIGCLATMKGGLGWIG